MKFIIVYELLYIGGSSLALIPVVAESGNKAALFFFFFFNMNRPGHSTPRQKHRSMETTTTTKTVCFAWQVAINRCEFPYRRYDNDQFGSIGWVNNGCCSVDIQFSRSSLLFIEPKWSIIMINNMFTVFLLLFCILTFTECSNLGFLYYYYYNIPVIVLCDTCAHRRQQQRKAWSMI